VAAPRPSWALAAPRRPGGETTLAIVHADAPHLRRCCIRRGNGRPRRAATNPEIQAAGNYRPRPAGADRERRLMP
jgi:hypothetical protein